MHFYINRMSFQILDTINPLVTEGLSEEMSKNQDPHFFKATERLHAYKGLGQDIFSKILTGSPKQSKEFIDQLRTVIIENSRIIEKTLNCLHPYPDPEILSFFHKEILHFVGTAEAIHQIAHFTKTDNRSNDMSKNPRNYPSIDKQEMATLHTLLHKVLPSMHNILDCDNIVKKIYNYSVLAKKNNIF